MVIGKWPLVSGHWPKRYSICLLTFCLLYGWELLMVCHHPKKFQGKGHCGNADVLKLLRYLARCHVT